jgi:hypothetical protein
MRVAVTLLFLVSVIIGCDNIDGPDLPDPALQPLWSGGVSLLAVQGVYGRGEAAEARLINGSDGLLGFNFCMAGWELWSGDSWRRVTPLRMCAGVLSTVPPKGEALLREVVEQSWEMGRYRFVLSVVPLPDGEPFEVTSNVFRVGR